MVASATVESKASPHTASPLSDVWSLGDGAARQPAEVTDKVPLQGPLFLCARPGSVPVSDIERLDVGWLPGEWLKGHHD